MTPKICVILGTDEDGNQKYVELTQQQALAYNAGALPIIQNAIGAGGGQQYILTDQVTMLSNFFFFVTDEEVKQARVFAPGKPFQPGPNVIKLFLFVIYEILQ